MNNDKPLAGWDKDLFYPLLTMLSDFAARFVGIRFSVIISHGDTWEHISPSGPSDLPEFCKLIHKTADGAKQCRMCHILMAIAACSSGVAEQRCHAGVSVLIHPISYNNNVCLSVLSSCLFLPSVKEQAWKETAERGKRLGIDLHLLRKTFNELPELTGEKLAMAKSLMRIAAETAMEIQTRKKLEKQLYESGNNTRKASGGIQNVMQQQLRQAMILPEGSLLPPPCRKASPRKNNKTPTIIQITAEMVRKKSNMPFTVADIAAAARMTPNHFSTLFHKHMGQNFSSFLTDTRISEAKKLLHNLRLSVGEVAHKAGFDDPGYFTRRFRQKTGKTPREWRESL